MEDQWGSVVATSFDFSCCSYIFHLVSEGIKGASQKKKREKNKAKVGDERCLPTGIQIGFFLPVVFLKEIL